MNCEQAENLIAEALAGELSVADRAALDEHLQTCARCRQLQSEWLEDDRQLRAGFAAWRGASDSVAARTIRQLHREQVVSAPRPTSRTGLTFSAGLAAGFLLALGLWRPWIAEPVANNSTMNPTLAPATTVAPPTADTSKSMLVSVVGNVEMLADEQSDWATAQAGSEVSLGCSIRTQSDGLCEFTCPDGQRARLNVDTEVRVHGDDELELVRGQVWAGAQPERELRVRTSAGAVRTKGGSINVRQGAEETVVTAASGDAVMRLVSHEESLGTGDELTITGQQVARRDRAYSLALITAWMNPLLALKSPDDPELSAHVDALLSHLGETKMSLLSDTELRTLGASCTVPLSRYIRSERSQGQTERRRHAARLLADLAPLALTGDMIGLLSDEDSEVRSQAAACLRRLTGQEMGCSVEQWRNPPDDIQRRALEAWTEWWGQNSFRCQPAPRAEPTVDKRQT